VPSPKLQRPFVALLAVASLAGCGPFGYLSKVSKDASKAVADAERAEAPKYAPYEYWGAVTYLEQAKLLMAYSEYERSFDYGGRARQLAEEAKRKAERRESGKMKETLDTKAAADAKKDAGKSSSAGTGDAPTPAPSDATTPPSTPPGGEK
jgi:predicted small lipoprotein YifL